MPENMFSQFIPLELAYNIESLNPEDKISRMKDILRDLGVKNQSLNLINYLLDYAGKARR